MIQPANVAVLPKVPEIQRTETDPMMRRVRRIKATDGEGVSHGARGRLLVPILSCKTQLSPPRC